MFGKMYSLRTSQLLLYIVDNDPVGIHQAGYNGLAALIPKALGNNVFVPSFGGMHYETTRIVGLNQQRDHIFEPRLSPMYVLGADDERVVLHQPFTDYKGIEAHISFFIEEPYFIHQHIRLTFHKEFGRPMGFSSTWANYIHMPTDRYIYSQLQQHKGARDGWMGITRTDHGASDYITKRMPSHEVEAAAHVRTMDNAPVLPHYAQINGPLSFYYGLYYDHAFLLMFKEPERVRLAYSPCGGGKEPFWNPAWNYTLQLDDVIIGQSYEWHVCLAFKPFAGRQDILDEVRRYQAK